MEPKDTKKTKAADPNQAALSDADIDDINNMMKDEEPGQEEQKEDKPVDASKEVAPAQKTNNSEVAAPKVQNNVILMGDEIRKIVAGTKIEKDANVIAAMFHSGYFKSVQSLSQAITRALIGAEMGIGVVQSINSLYVIDGKVAMDSHAIRQGAVAAGYQIRTIELTNEKCVLEWSREGKVLGTSEYTMEDAHAAGLANKPNWKANPKDMLLARATTRGRKMYAGDSFNGLNVYTPEELTEVEKTSSSELMPDLAEKINTANSREELSAILEGLDTETRKKAAPLINNRVKELR